MDSFKNSRFLPEGMSDTEKFKTEEGEQLEAEGFRQVGVHSGIITLRRLEELLTLHVPKYDEGKPGNYVTEIRVLPANRVLVDSPEGKCQYDKSFAVYVKREDVP